MIFFTDITRPPFLYKTADHDDLQGPAGNAFFVYNLFKKQIEEVSGQKVTFFLENKNFNQEKFYSSMRIKYQEENWVKIYDAKPTDDAIAYLGSFLNSKNELILSYEASPLLLKIFDILKINYLDLRIGSIKYLDDLIFGFKTNNSKIFAQILKYKVSEDQFEFEAALLKSRLQLINQTIKIKAEKNSAVFAGQMVSDASLIKNGKLLNILDFKEKFKEKAKKYDVIYYQKHPLAKDDLAADDFIFSFSNVKVLKTNLYHLMCAENIKEIFSISSGSLQEAEFFGKKTDYFFKSMYQFVKDDEKKFTAEKYISVYRKFLEPNFWADILKPVMKTKNYGNIEIAPNESRVRYLHNIYWGYDSLIKDYNVFYKDSSFYFKEIDEKFKKLNNKRMSRKIGAAFRGIKRIFFRKFSSLKN